jgi:hypothetical protein
MTLPAYQNYICGFTLIDKAVSSASTTEQGTLPHVVQGTSITDAISVITALNLTHWALTSISYNPNWVAPTTPTIATSSAAQAAGATGGAQAANPPIKG